MIKRWLVVLLGVVALGFLTGANSCTPKLDTPYTWEVYAATAGCECKKYDGKAENWSHVTTLLRVDYGFGYATGKPSIKHATGVPTPFHVTDFSPSHAITVDIFAQAAEPVTLVCVIYQGELILGAMEGSEPGTCSGSSDI